MSDNLDILTDEQLNEVFAVEVAGLGPEYVLKKRGLYYRSDAQGYTDRIEKAWRLSSEEAEKWVYPYDEKVTKHLADRLPYSTSFDAVLPFLETFLSAASHSINRREWSVSIIDPSDGSPEESAKLSAEAYAQHPARAACVALIIHVRKKKGIK